MGLLNDRHFSSIPRIPKGFTHTPFGNGYLAYCVQCGKNPVIVIEGTGSLVWQCDKCFAENGALPAAFFERLDEEEDRLLREAPSRIRTLGVG